MKWTATQIFFFVCAIGAYMLGLFGLSTIHTWWSGIVWAAFFVLMLPTALTACAQWMPPDTPDSITYEQRDWDKREKEFDDEWRSQER